MKNKLSIAILCFLLLIPFRLPISISFIYLFEWIINITSNEVIPKDVLATNIIVSKLVYNLAISILFVVNLELFSREKFGRKAKTKDYAGRIEEQPIYWYIVPVSALLLIFILIDSISIHKIFFL